MPGIIYGLCLNRLCLKYLIEHDTTATTWTATALWAVIWLYSHCSTAMLTIKLNSFSKFPISSMKHQILRDHLCVPFFCNFVFSFTARETLHYKNEIFLNAGHKNVWSTRPRSLRNPWPEPIYIIRCCA